MGILGKLLKTTIDLATLPVDIVKDAATLGGALTEDKSAVSKKAKRLKRDLDEIRDETDKL